MKIGIICGHGNGDPGAISKRYGKEADLVRKLAPLVKKHLEKYKGVYVDIFNTSINHYTYLKSHKIDFKKYDYIIELHANAGAHDPNGNGATTGIEIWVTPREKGISVEENICKEIASLGFKNRGVKREDFYVINKIKSQGVSACLIENGFIDDADDMKLLTNDMDKYAEKLALGVANGFGLKKQTTAPTIKTVQVNSKVKIKSGAVYGGLASTRGKKVPESVIKRVHTVKKLQTNKGIQEALLKEINSWVAVSSLTVI